jgi:hypothetical protein
VIYNVYEIMRFRSAETVICEDGVAFEIVNEAGSKPFLLPESAFQQSAVSDQLTASLRPRIK